MVGEVAARVRALASDYRPPSFAHVLNSDAALFLCAADHQTGYRRPHLVDGRGPFSGSELLWEVGLRANRLRPGLMTAAGLATVGGGDVAAILSADDETVADPDRRARQWRDLATGLASDYDGSAAALLEAADGRLGGEGGLIVRLGAFEAYADPLAKKAFLFAKIADRRGWFEVADPDSWEVCADNVLMRLALRSGLVEPGGVDEVRRATRAAFKGVAAEAGIPPPVLDDLLWELGGDDPDLLGRAAGDLREPPRDSDSTWY